jgi:hypothetical protein
MTPSVMLGVQGMKLAPYVSTFCVRFLTNSTCSRPHPGLWTRFGIEPLPVTNTAKHQL